MKFIYDPYDIWSTEVLGRLKVSVTQGNFFSKLVLPFVGILELVIPISFRRLLNVKKHYFPHIESMCLPKDGGNKEILSFLKGSAIKVGSGVGWGLPFRWFSKNGVYSSNTPYVTNTPYVMEALIKESWPENDQALVNDLFQSTWGFLDSLKILHITDKELALSYAPIDEPLLVINANSYAALAYALHVKYGCDDVKEAAFERVTKLVNWVVNQQQDDGSWYYYADKDQGNFIDCFHSCFIIKNLLKVKALIPDVADHVDPVVKSGWSFLQNDFYDKKSGLCRRFVQRDIKDPFRWDLYDQAEYLGLLVDFGLYDEASRFAKHVEDIFKKGDNWYCKIDLFGRRWGKNFMRWGIVPFQYHKVRLTHALNEEATPCVA
ncbi:MAG: hypothetical protein JKY52_08740 [Flavobacteriales bacterium]|nr:hypothetical protein [Flavobacteriales bacterium]